MKRPLPTPALSRSVVDRSAVHRGDEPWLAIAWHAPATKVIRVFGQQVAVAGEEVVTGHPGDVPPERRLFLGEHAESAYFAIMQDEPDPELEYAGLRELGVTVDDLHAGLIVHAIAVANWHAAHPRCSRCGAATEPALAGHVRRGPADGSEHYPRTDPAVIMLVVDRDDRLLLGRQVSWPEGRFSTLAGFVEPGESLETAVRREVDEEAGVRVGRVAYLGSQPWPFPSSLMLGFGAEALTTELSFKDGELAEARWFSRDDYRRALEQGEVASAAGISISLRLIEHWYGRPLPTPSP